MNAIPLRSDPVMIDAPELMTADAYMAYDLTDDRTELIRGRLVVREPPGPFHGLVVFELSFLVGQYLSEMNPRPGQGFSGDTSFWISRDPDTVRASDFAYVKRERLESGVNPSGVFESAPDLAVEVRSPSERTGKLLQKVGQWLDAGCSLVWVIDPARKRAHVYTPDGTVTLLGEDGSLDGEDVLPGLKIQLASLWGE